MVTGITDTANQDIRNVPEDRRLDNSWSATSDKNWRRDRSKNLLVAHLGIWVGRMELYLGHE